MSIISPEYAKELEDELNKAYEIRPDMFHKELVDGFADRILKSAEENGLACINLMKKFVRSIQILMQNLFQHLSKLRLNLHVLLVVEIQKMII